jgi:hypothetical protein
MAFRLNTSVSSSYSHLAIVFFAMTTILTVVRGIFHDVFKENYLTYLVPIVAPFGVLFFLFIVRLVRNLGVSELFFRFVVGLLVISLVFRLSSVVLVTDMRLRLGLGLFSSTCLVVMQAVCVYFMCNNLFIQENPIKEKLWASVCVYFMIGATFGTLYSLLFTLNPGALGIAITSPIEVYILGLVYSFNVISGLDPVYDAASESVRMTAVLESIFIMLFMVILIGRLLGSKD